MIEGKPEGLIHLGWFELGYISGLDFGLCERALYKEKGSRRVVIRG